MKSIHFIKLLFASVFIVTLPLSSYANLTGEKKAVGQWQQLNPHQYGVKVSAIRLKMNSNSADWTYFTVRFDTKYNGNSNPFAKYKVSTKKLTIKTPKGNYELSDLRLVEDGWFEFVFEEPLYICYYDPNVIYENMMVCVMSGASSQNSNYTSNKSNNNPPVSRNDNTKNENSKKAEKENFKSMIKDFNKFSPSHGFNLIKTNTIGGLKCEHYEVNGEKLRVFYNSKGDYILGKEDIDGFDVEPETMKDFLISNGGSFRIHLEDGVLEANNNLEITKLLSTNGNVLFCSLGTTIDFSWQDFKSGEVMGTKLIDIINDFSNKKDLNNENENYLSPRGKCALVIATNPKDTLTFSEFGGFCAIKIGDNLYSVNKEDLKLRSIAKRFEGHYYPCLPSDSIVSVIKGDNMYKINFANGDYFEFDKQQSLNGNSNYAGSLHRGNAIMSFIAYPDCDASTIKYPDGSVFHGEVRPEKYHGHYPRGQEILTIEKWLPHNGTMRYPNGKSLAYKGGKSELDRLAAEDAKKKKEEATYDSLCKQYGKRFVDAAKKGTIIIGMPEKLLVKSFDTRLKKTEGNKKCYYIYSVTGHLAKEVWVVNGKVSSITNSSSRKVVYI